MAYDPNDPNQTNTAAQTTPTSNPTSGATAGTSATSTAGQYAAGTPGQSSSSTSNPGTDNSQYTNARQQKGTGFTNMQQILGANQGYGQKIGQTIGQGLQNQATNVNNTIQSGQNQFNTAATTNYNTANNAVNAAGAYEQNQQAGESNDAYAARLAGSNADLSAIGTGLQNAAYSGPTGLNNSNQIQSQAATASALGQLAGSTGGQGQLLANMVAKRGNYTQGDSTLDNLLLGQGGEQYVQQGAQGLSNIGNTANNAIAGAANQATNYTNAINTNKQNTTSALQNYLSGAGDGTSNGITGFTTMAQNQGTTFNNNATRLGQLISGNNPDGTPVNYTKLNATDSNLLQNLSQYGLGNASVYDHTQYGAPPDEAATAQRLGLTNANDIVQNNQSQINAALQSLGSNLNETQGGSYYQGNQSQAAQNLAAILGQSDIKSSIANNQFNTNVFDPTSAFQGLANEKVGDQAAANQYTGVANTINQNQGLYNQINGVVTGPQYDENSLRDQMAVAQSQSNGNANGTLMASPNYTTAGNYNQTQQAIQNETGAENAAIQLNNLTNGQVYTADPRNLATGNANSSALLGANEFNNLASNSVGQDVDLQNYVMALMGQKANKQVNA